MVNLRRLTKILIHTRYSVIGLVCANSPVDKSTTGNMESSMPIDDLYETIGEAPIIRLVAAFYAQIPADEILAPMYPSEDLPGAEQRLRDFLIFRFGGPQHYIEQRGHPRLRMRHAPFQIDQRARDRWMALMTKAFEESEFPAEARQAVLDFFGTTATFMINR